MVNLAFKLLNRLAFFIFGGRGFHLMYLCRTGSGFYVYSFSMMDFFAGFVSQ